MKRTPPLSAAEWADLSTNLSRSAHEAQLAYVELNNGEGVSARCPAAVALDGMAKEAAGRVGAAFIRERRQVQ